MSLSAAEHAQVLARLLPTGPVWPTSEQSDGTDDFSKLLSAMSGEPAQVGADLELLIAEAIPNSALTDLDAWERIVGVPDEDLSDAERLARIQGILVGPGSPDRATLELYAQRMAGSDEVKLFNRVGPSASAGICNAGDSLFVGAWDFTALCELMRNILFVAEDEFDSWTGFVSVTDAIADSPVTLDSTASAVELGATHATTPMGETVDGDTVYSSIWVRNVSAAAVDFELSYLKRDNTGSTPQISTLQVGAWNKITYEASVGTGVTTPLLRVRCPDGTSDLELSWVVAGVRATGLQARIAARFPLHTSVHFGVFGEFETLLAHEDQTEVCF